VKPEQDLVQEWEFKEEGEGKIPFLAKGSDGGFVLLEYRLHVEEEQKKTEIPHERSGSIFDDVQI
jgi:hypothetical protein